MARATASPPVLPGYEYVRLLGSGGFSDVFLYDQEFPKRRVAVKVLLTEDLSPATRTAFVAEANLMAQLSAHPYIVTIFQADVAEDDRPYFVMEYCSGPSLADRYKRERFSVADALQTGVRLSSAIATAHSVGILHRDIKPANVLTNDFGWPALTDFGISSATEGDFPAHTTTSSRPTGSESNATTGSASVGMSIPWSPPEMFEDEPDPDVRSDVFSLAATIYTLLAGHTPFEVRGRSNSSVDLVGRIVRGAITPLARDDVPRSLLAVLHKGMSSEPGDRFASAVDFARALQRVELELSYSQTPIDVPNLAVKAPVREETSDGPDPDATRARSIATVQAQTPPPTVDAGATRVRSVPVVAPDAGATAVRDAPVSASQPHSEAPSETVVRPAKTATVDEATEQPPARRKNPVALAVSLMVGLVVIGGAVTAVIASGSLSDPGTSVQPPSTSVGANPDAVVGDVVPAPILVSKSLEGASATFIWSNPDPQQGDSYLWQRTDGPSEGRSVVPTTETQAVVDGIDGASSVCVRVDIRRQNGSTSASSLEECLP